ncbi:hypothetical protein L596_007727 [Steinernema carpocapsae]|uniref:Uncharacterized protein n=1 Tax=Steinernema carpocapsae TaxID=34508 RepID=A0A4U5PAB1_STECR|nr:hypothetical protein L596_007727 [Steinernema carpocapsae]
MRSSSRCESGRLFVQTWPLLTVNRNYDGEQRCRLSQGLRRVQYEHQPYRGPQRHRRVLHIGHADLCKSVHSLVARPRAQKENLENSSHKIFVMVIAHNMSKDGHD